MGMRSWVRTAREESVGHVDGSLGGDVTRAVVTSVSAATCLDGGPPPDLDALDYTLLASWTERATMKALAEKTGLTVAGVRARTLRPAFQQALQRLQRSLFDRLARGEYGVLALAKGNAVGAFKRVLQLSRAAENERVRLDANLEIMKLAGVQPPKPAVVESPERLLDQMSPEELEHFSKTNEIPRRLGDQVAKLAVTALQAKASLEAEIEWEVIDGEGASPVEPPPRHRPAPPVDDAPPDPSLDATMGGPLDAPPEQPEEVPDEDALAGWGEGIEETALDEEAE